MNSRNPWLLSVSGPPRLACALPNNPKRIVFSFRKPVLSDSISGAANKASNQSAGIVLSVPAYPKRGSHHARLSGLCRWREFPGEPKLEEFFCETDTARRCAGGND